MKKSLLIFIIAAATLIFFDASSNGLAGGKSVPGTEHSTAGAHKPAVHPDFGKVPVYFIPNQGQVDGEVLYYARTSRYTLWLTKSGLHFDSWTLKSPSAGFLPGASDGRDRPGDRGDAADKRDVTALIFHGAADNTEVLSSRPTEHCVNFLLGDDPSRWRTDIRTSASIIYKNIYKDIDLDIHGLEKEVECDWVLNPGGRVEDIRFEYTDILGTSLDKEGNLVVKTRLGEIVHRRPVAYQEIKGRRVPVEARFRKIEGNIYGFGVRAYDRSRPLVIDPVVLVYSTFLGGNKEDKGWAIAVDRAGAAYVTGHTVSSNFPKRWAYDSVLGGTDVFVTKFAASGKTLSYSTYFGGKSSDWGLGIAVDKAAAAYVTGYTLSSDFPVKSAYDGVFNSGTASDAFVAKLTPAGNILVYSTYLGGKGADIGRGIAVDGRGSAYVTGSTESPDFPKKNPNDGVLGGSKDAFVVKFSPSGNALLYATYLGGSGQDQGKSIALDAQKAAYITGDTMSADFPAINALDNSLGGERDAFATKLSPAGKLAYSTYLGGGGGEEYGQGIVTDSTGAAYVAGHTDSTDFPTLNPYSAASSGQLDVFLAKIAPSGTSFVYSTYLGGNSEDEACGVAVNSSGEAHVAGYTDSANFPVPEAYDSSYGGGHDAFLTKFSAAGNALVYSTYIGGAGDDNASGVAVDGAGAAYITGSTASSDFPKVGAFDPGYNGNADAFVAKLEVPPPAEGMWLEYWSGSMPGRLNLSVQYYSVRFTKPAGWNNVKIDKIKIYFDSTGQNIALCFWKNAQLKSGTYWPSGNPLKGATVPIIKGNNTWETLPSSWITGSQEFFVGFEQKNGYASLCSDGKCQPQNRSYRVYSGKAWEQEWGMFANYCISVYVIRK